MPVHGVQYMFPSHRWLCKDEADGKVEVEIYPSETLEIEKCMYFTIIHLTNAVLSSLVIIPMMLLFQSPCFFNICTQNVTVMSELHVEIQLL